MRGDLEDLESLRTAAKGCDAIFHTAAVTTSWVRGPGKHFQVNVVGTRNILIAAEMAEVERVVHMIADLIEASSVYYYHDRETLRILDPCCGAGDAIDRPARRIHQANAVPIETYGVELHKERAGEAGKRLDRFLATDLFQTSIANRAFNVLYLNPPYDFDGDQKRTEHAFLTYSVPRNAA